MEEKYFLHRIQEENGAFIKGIEIHETKDAAIQSFCRRMKLGFNNPERPGMTFVSCKVTDILGNVVNQLDMTWRKAGEEGNSFFMHHIKVDGSTVEKAIDDCPDFDAARLAYARCMEYGYNNTKYPNVSYIACEITDRSGSVLAPFHEVWLKPEQAEE